MKSSCTRGRFIMGPSNISQYLEESKNLSQNSSVGKFVLTKTRKCSMMNGVNYPKKHQRIHLSYWNNVDTDEALKSTVETEASD